MSTSVPCKRLIADLFYSHNVKKDISSELTPSNQSVKVDNRIMFFLSIFIKW